MTADAPVTAAELTGRTLRFDELVPDTAAFLDTRIPGSEKKINYPLIGPGVSENATQVVPVSAPHGFNLGAAAMPAGTVNNLHLHYTAEVFFCFGGPWTFRWGADGTDGTATVRDGDVISIPTWIFRGFTSESDGAFLFTALGRDVSGGLIWAPSVIAESARYGMHLTTDHRLIETAPGEVPAGVELVAPLSAADLAGIRSVSVDEMRTRLTTPADLVWHDDALLDAALPGGGARLALVIGYGLAESRRAVPRLTEPHGFSVAWLQAEPGRGVNRHRHDDAQALIVRSGRWRVTLNEGDAEVGTEIGPFDTLSVPAGAWRRLESVGDEAGRLILLTAGEGRTRIEWAPDVVAAARAAGVALDPNGYRAPAHLLP